MLRRWGHRRRHSCNAGIGLWQRFRQMFGSESKAMTRRQRFAVPQRQLAVGSRVGSRFGRWLQFPSFLCMNMGFTHGCPVSSLRDSRPFVALIENRLSQLLFDRFESGPQHISTEVRIKDSSDLHQFPSFFKLPETQARSEDFQPGGQPFGRAGFGE